MRRPGAVLVALVVVLAVGGCGDDGEPTTSPTTDVTAPADDSTTTTSTVVEDPLPDTLAELVGPAPRLDPAAAQEWYLDRESERQEAIAECMDEQGFSYVPLDPAELGENPWSPEIDWESEEWVRTYGFGISTLRYPASVVGPDLVGYVDDPADGGPGPNQAHVEELGPDEQDAWRDAFQDCDARTWEESQSQNLVAAFNEQFSDELTEMYDELAADPRYEEITSDIRRCVNDRGVDFTDRQTTFQEIESRLVPLDDEITADAASPEALDRLATIQAEEIAVASAVADCGGRFLSQNDDYQALVAEYEAEFIADHEDELRDFLDDA